jgi:lantibiotic transport system permease protein
MIQRFINTWYTDWIKYRKSSLIWASAGYSLLSVFLVFILTAGMKNVPENATFQFMRNNLSVGAFFLPFYLVLIITILAHIEHRNQGWKLMFSQPVGRGYCYFSKLSFILLSFVLVYLFYFLFSLISIYLITISKVQFKVSEFFSLIPVFFKPQLKIMLSCTAMIAIQYWLSIRLKYFIWPFGLGVVGTMLPLAVFIILGIAGIIGSPEKLNVVLKYDPYSLPFSFVFDYSMMKSNLSIVEIPFKFILGSLSTGFFIMFLGFVDLHKRNIY